MVEHVATLQEFGTCSNYKIYDIHILAQITEMYSSGGDLHLELLSGQLQGSKSLWVSEIIHSHTEGGIGTRRCVPIREVSSFERVLCTGFNGVAPEDLSL